MLASSIFIADAQTLTREGLKAIIANKSELEIIGSAANNRELRTYQFSHSPVLFIIDCFAPGYFEPEDVAFIKDRFPLSRILVVTMNQEQDEILNLLNLDIDGYILKECSADEMLHAIGAIIRKEHFYCGRVMDTMISILRPHQCAPGSICDNCKLFSLSDREVQIIQLIAEGYTNKAIASKLCLSIHTIGSHRKNIFRKLNIRSASELTLYAIQKGIISAEELVHD